MLYFNCSKSKEVCFMKKGFTLIELLAVIVILAIISLIAIPQIANVIENVRTNALKSSADGLVEAAYLYGVQNEISNNVRFDINDNIQTSLSGDKLNYKGNIKKGTVIINTNCEIAICVTDGTNSAYKNFEDKSVLLETKKVCNIIFVPSKINSMITIIKIKIVCLNDFIF